LSSAVKSSVMDKTNEECTSVAGEDRFLSVNAIQKELEETTARTQDIVHKIKALQDEVTKLKESLMIMTGAKLAFQKIVDASKKHDKAGDAVPTVS